MYNSRPTVYPGQSAKTVKVNQEIYSTNTLSDHFKQTKESHEKINDDLCELKCEVNDINNKIKMLLELYYKKQSSEYELYGTMKKILNGHEQSYKDYMTKTLTHFSKTNEELINQLNHPKELEHITKLVNFTEQLSSKVEILEEKLNQLNKITLDSQDMLSNNVILNEILSKVISLENSKKEEEINHLIADTGNQEATVHQYKEESEKDTEKSPNEKDLKQKEFNNEKVKDSKEKEHTQRSDKHRVKTIENLISTLPENYLVSSLIVNGKRIQTSKFVRFDKKNRIAYFLQDDVQITVDIEEINSMVIT
jgi:hypothetical protein